MLQNKKEEIAANHRKADIRIKIDLSLLAVAFTLFTFIYAVNSSLLKENSFVSLQLVLAIPLLVTAALAKSKMSYSENGDVWNNFSFITFIIAYGFLVNVIGLLLVSAVSIFSGILYFFVNILLAVSYSVVNVIQDKSKIIDRVRKDLFFAAIIVFLGILPSLGVY